MGAPFGGLAQDWSVASPRTCAAITPSDSTDLTNIANISIFVTTGGTLVFRLVGDVADSTITVPNNTQLRGQFKLIKAATGASGIFGFGA